MKNDKLTFSQLLAYALPNLALGILIVPVSVFLPNIYAKNTGVTLAAIGVVMAFTRMFDAVSDQAIGYFSDITRTRLGARFPWMLAGTPCLMLSAYFLFTPPADADIWYYGIWSFLFYFSYTMIAIPYLAWGSESSGDYNERSRIFSWYAVTTQIGGLLFFATPVVLFYLGVVDKSEFDTEQVSYITTFAVMLLPIVMLFAVFKGKRTEGIAQVKPDFKGLMVCIRRNRPLQLFVLIYLLWALGFGAFAGVLVIFLDSYMGLADKISWILIAVGTVSVLSVYPWSKVIYRFGKHKPWALSWVVSAAVPPLLIFVDPAGQHVFWWVLLILMLHGFVEGLSNITPGAMMADVVDYEILKSGADRAGNFYAFQNFMYKAAIAIGAGFGLIMLGWFDYNVKEPHLNDELAKWGMLFTVLIFPSITKLLSAVVVWYFPIDARRQSIIRRRIESLAQRDRQEKLAV